jgi:hypothetical protein
MDSLQDVIDYLDYQLSNMSKTVRGWGGKQTPDVMWYGIKSAQTIVKAAHADPEAFHKIVDTMKFCEKEGKDPIKQYLQEGGKKEDDTARI